MDQVLLLILQNADRISGWVLAVSFAVYFVKRDTSRQKEILDVINKYHQLATDQVVTLARLLERLDENDAKN